MSAAHLVQRYADAGIAISVRQGTLVVRAPVGALTDAVRRELGRQKPGLLAALATHPCGTCGRFAFRTPTRCYWCRAHGRSEARP